MEGIRRVERARGVAEKLLFQDMFFFFFYFAVQKQTGKNVRDSLCFMALVMLFVLGK